MFLKSLIQNIKPILIREEFKYEKNSRISLLDIFKDRLKLLTFVIIYPIRYLKFEKRNFNDVFIDPFSSNAEVSTLRKEYIKKYDNLETTAVNYTHGIYIGSLRDVLVFFRTYFLNIIKVFFSLFDISSIRYIFLSNYFLNDIICNIYDIKRVYFFNFLDSSNYILANKLSKRYNIEVYYIYSIGHLYSQARYDQLNENINIILSSKIQKNEMDFIKNIGWYKSDGPVKIWGNDNFIHEDKLLNNISNNIGIFSSGDWARGSNGLILPIDDLKNGKFGNELPYIVFMEILSILSKIEKNIKVKMYFHPLEKKLYKKGVEPPYLKELGKHIDISDIENSGMSNYLESDIGIVVQSSVFYLREHKDMKTYFFHDKKRITNPRMFLNIKVLKEYKDQSYSNGEELFLQISKDLDIVKK